MKSRGVSAIGAVGFCWGGEFFCFLFSLCFSQTSVTNVTYDISDLCIDIVFYVLFLAKAVVELAKYDNFLHAAVLCHPSFVTVDDCKGMISALDIQETCTYLVKISDLCIIRDNRLIVLSQFINLLIKLELLAAVKVPISILGAEIDPISPPDVVKQFEEVLTAKTEVRISFIKKINNKN